MKLLGILLLFLASTGAGFFAAGQLRREVRQLEQLTSLLTDCAAYIRCQSPEVPELLLMLAGHPSYCHLHFLQEVSQQLSPVCTPEVVWREALAHDREVPASAREILLHFGLTLGTTDIPGQTAALALQQEQLKQITCTARERFQKQGKLYRTAGALIGGMLALLLC